MIDPQELSLGVVDQTGYRLSDAPPVRDGLHHSPVTKQIPAMQVRRNFVGGKLPSNIGLQRQPIVAGAVN